MASRGHGSPILYFERIGALVLYVKQAKSEEINAPRFHLLTLPKSFGPSEPGPDSISLSSYKLSSLKALRKWSIIRPMLL